MFDENKTILDVALHAIRCGYDGNDLDHIYESMQDFGYKGVLIVNEATGEKNPDVLSVEKEADRILSGDGSEIGDMSLIAMLASRNAKVKKEMQVGNIFDDAVDKLRIAILSGDLGAIDSELDRLVCKLANEHGDTVIAKSLLRSANKLLIHYPDDIKQSIKENPYS